MKLANPINTEHEIIFIPRYYVPGDLTLDLTNETTKEVLTYTLTPITLDGYVYLNFEESFDNNSRYQIKITENENIVFRGILFVTDQTSDTQDYKISKNIFTYE